eukprot:CFRG6993T1
MTLPSPTTSKSIMDDWEGEGKIILTRKLDDFCKSAATSDNESKSDDEVQMLIYDLLLAVASGVFPKENLCGVLQALCEAQDEAIAKKLLDRVLDSVWLLDLNLAPSSDTDTFEPNSDRWRLAEFIKGCSKNSVFAFEQLKLRLEPGMLKQVGAIANSKNFSKSIIIARTKKFFKQNKFNLCREVAEGYSRLVDELIPDVNRANAISKSKTAVMNVTKVIGFFSLDPNRVCEIMLNCFEEMVDDNAYVIFFLSMLKLYQPAQESLTGLLGFRFKSHHEAIKNLTVEEHATIPTEGLTPRNLYKMAAIIIKEDLVDVIRLWEFLIPEDASMLKQMKERKEALSAAANKINIQDLSKTGDEGAAQINVDVVKRQEMETFKAIQRRNDLIYFLNNQKLNLMHHMITIHDLKSVQVLFLRVPMDLVLSSPKTVDALLSIVHAAIEPVYRPLMAWKSMCNTHVANITAAADTLETNGNGVTVCRKLTDLADSVYPILVRVGCQAYQDPVLLTKLVRIAKKVQDETLASADNERLQELWEETKNVLVRVVLTSMSMAPGNPGLNEAVFSIVKPLPYQERYRLYAAWQDMYIMLGPLQLRKAWTTFESRRALRRLAKDDPEVAGRTFCKIAHSNPFILYEEILGKVQVYDNFIQPLLEGFSTLTDMDKDILVFSVVVALQKAHTKRSDLMSMGIRALALFCGKLFHRMWATDFQPLLFYVAGQLSRGAVLDLEITKGLIEHMAAVESTDDVSDERIEALCGGTRLKIEAGSYIKQDFDKINAKSLVGKPTIRLMDALRNTRLVLPLIVLIERRKRDLFQTKRSMKMGGKIIEAADAGVLYDQCQDSLCQLIEFVQRYLSDEDYSKLIPPFRVLVEEYGLSLELCFYLHRPIISRQTTHESLVILNGDSMPTKLMVAGLQAFEKVIAPYVAEVTELYPNRWGSITPELFVTFWSMSQYDLKVPTAIYETELKKMRDQHKDIVEKNPSNKQKKLNVLNSRIASLEKELAMHTTHQKTIVYRFRKEAAKFFREGCGQSGVDDYINHCVSPRVSFSPTDSLFCAEFTRQLHKENTPNFATHAYLERIMLDVETTVCCGTANQAQRFGRFLSATLSWMMSWTKDKGVFMRLCGLSPGFKSVTKNNESRVSYQDYLKNVFNIQTKVLPGSFLAMLNSNDSINHRNSLQVLQRIAPSFPVIKRVGLAINKAALLHQNDQSLSTTVVLYQGIINLKTRENAWISDEQLGHITPKPAPKHKTEQPMPTSKSTTTNPKDNLAPPQSSSRGGMSKSENSANTNTNTITAKGNTGNASQAQSQSSRDRDHPTITVNKGNVPNGSGNVRGAGGGDNMSSTTTAGSTKSATNQNDANNSSKIKTAQLQNEGSVRGGGGESGSAQRQRRMTGLNGSGQAHVQQQSQRGGGSSTHASPRAERPNKSPLLGSEKKTIEQSTGGGGKQQSPRHTADFESSPRSSGRERERGGERVVDRGVGGNQNQAITNTNTSTYNTQGAGGGDVSGRGRGRVNSATVNADKLRAPIDERRDGRQSRDRDRRSADRERMSTSASTSVGGLRKGVTGGYSEGASERDSRDRGSSRGRSRGADKNDSRSDQFPQAKQRGGYEDSTRSHSRGQDIAEEKRMELIRNKRGSDAGAWGGDRSPKRRRGPPNDFEEKQINANNGGSQSKSLRSRMSKEVSKDSMLPSTSAAGSVRNDRNEESRGHGRNRGAVSGNSNSNTGGNANFNNDAGGGNMGGGGGPRRRDKDNKRKRGKPKISR